MHGIATTTSITNIQTMIHLIESILFGIAVKVSELSCFTVLAVSVTTALVVDATSLLTVLVMSATYGATLGTTSPAVSMILSVSVVTVLTAGGGVIPLAAPALTDVTADGVVTGALA